MKARLDEVFPFLEHLRHFGGLHWYVISTLYGDVWQISRSDRIAYAPSPHPSTVPAKLEDG
jgi:hypothetical protein